MSLSTEAGAAHIYDSAPCWLKLTQFTGQRLTELQNYQHVYMRGPLSPFTACFYGILLEILCCTCEAEAWASYQERVSVERITDHWGSRLHLLCNEQNKRGAISSSLLDPDSNFCLVTCLMSSRNLLNLWVIWWKVKTTGACCWVSVLSACCAVQCMRYRSSTVWHHCTVRGLSLNLTLSSLVQTAPLFQTAERDSEPWTAPMCVWVSLWHWAAVCQQCVHVCVWMDECWQGL